MEFFGGDNSRVDVEILPPNTWVFKKTPYATVAYYPVENSLT